MSAGARAGRARPVGGPVPGSPLDGVSVRLGALASLVNDALAALGTRPAFAVAGGPGGPLFAASALETPATPRPVRARASRNLHPTSPRPSPRPHGDPPEGSSGAETGEAETLEVDETHVETWRLVG